MKRFSKAQRERHEALTTRLNDAFEGLEAAIFSYNEKVDALREKLLDPAAGVYAEVIEACVEFRDEISGDLDLYGDERSESWHEGDAGQAHAEWRDEWDCEIAGPDLEYDTADGQVALAETDFFGPDAWSDLPTERP